MDKRMKSIRKKYDLVIAVLSIHHLNDREKRALFVKVFSSMNSGGIFVIGDVIKGDSEKQTAKIEANWKKYLNKKLGNEEAEKWFKIYKKEDIPSSINEQILWLKTAGFSPKLQWKKMNCAVFYGKKL